MVQNVKAGNCGFAIFRDFKCETWVQVHGPQKSVQLSILSFHTFRNLLSMNFGKISLANWLEISVSDKTNNYWITKIKHAYFLARSVLGKLHSENNLLQLLVTWWNIIVTCNKGVALHTAWEVMPPGKWKSKISHH